MTVGCCTNCGGTGSDPSGPCWDCRSTGCAHAGRLCTLPNDHHSEPPP